MKDNSGIHAVWSRAQMVSMIGFLCWCSRPYFCLMQFCISGCHQGLGLPQYQSCESSFVQVCQAAPRPRTGILARRYRISRTFAVLLVALFNQEPERFLAESRHVTCEKCRGPTLRKSAAAPYADTHPLQRKNQNILERIWWCCIIRDWTLGLFMWPSSLSHTLS